MNGIDIVIIIKNKNRKSSLQTIINTPSFFCTQSSKIIKQYWVNTIFS